MLKILEFIGFAIFLIVAFASLMVVIAILVGIIKSFFTKEEPPRNPKYEMENDEYDWGHNVKYTCDDYE